jgi:hypothetical protein
MPETRVLFEIDKPHFTVRLYENMLKIDLKGRIRNEIEEALENKPVLRETIGGILSIFAPLHLRISDIDHVQMNETGKVKIFLPRHRDVNIPLQPNEAKKLVNKLNELIPVQKRKELLRIMREQSLQKTAEEQLELGRGSALQAYTETMAPAFEEEVAEAEEKEEQKKED